MSQTRWIVVTSVVLLLLPMVIAFVFPPRILTPVPELPPLSPQIVYRLPPAQPNDLSRVAVHVEGGLVSLRADTNFDTPGEALHCFIAALKTYPHARRIRASWSLLIFMNGMETSVLYDRSAHRLLLFSRGSGDLGSYHEHLLFTGVQESVFVKLADAHREDSQELPEGFFDDLARYGCRKCDLGSWQKAPKD